IDAVLVALVNLDRFLTVLGQHHVVAMSLQDRPADVADHRLIVDEQHRLAATAGHRGRRARAGPRSTVAGARYIDIEVRAGANRADTFDPALMLLDDAVDHGQT